MSNLIYRDEYKNDDRPLVEIIAGQCGERLDERQRWPNKVYRIEDWVRIVSGRSKSWNVDIKPKMQAEYAIEGRLYTYEYSVPVGIRGDTRMAEFCDDQGLYYITQFMPSSPTVHNVKDFLASAGVFVDAIRREPDKAVDLARDAYRMQGKSEEWIDTRLESKYKRIEFTDALKEAVGELVIQGFHYGIATNNIYDGLWKRTAEILKEQVGLSKKSSKLRDNQPRLGLMYQAIVEEICTNKLLDAGDTLPWNLIDSIVREVAMMIGKQARETGRWLDTDLATGKSLSENPNIKRLYAD